MNVTVKYFIDLLLCTIWYKDEVKPLNSAALRRAAWAFPELKSTDGEAEDTWFLVCSPVHLGNRRVLRQQLEVRVFWSKVCGCSHSTTGEHTNAILCSSLLLWVTIWTQSSLFILTPPLWQIQTYSMSPTPYSRSLADVYFSSSNNSIWNVTLHTALRDPPPLLCQTAPISLILSQETDPKPLLLHFSISDSNCRYWGCLCYTHAGERNSGTLCWDKSRVTSLELSRISPGLSQ